MRTDCIGRNTAKALDLEIAPMRLALADEVMGIRSRIDAPRESGTKDGRSRARTGRGAQPLADRQNASADR